MARLGKTELRCDAEIGKPPTWGVCLRRAVVAIRSASGIELHYCERHRDRASDRSGKHFKRATFAEPREIST